MTPHFTVGVEEEYQLVSPPTGELQSSARLVLAADWSGDIRKELQESTIEIGTRICADSLEVGAELKRLRLVAATAASSEDLAIVAAGVHPFSRWEQHEMTSDDRYARMAETYGRVAKDEHNFGMHIHVAVPEAQERVPLLNILRWYIPHLTALSCSSPFFEGEDTGYASYRMILWRRWPASGVPPRLTSDREYRTYVDTLLRAGAIGDERNLYWSIRIHPEYPTLEYRMCDVCPRVEDAVAITALARTLVAAAAMGELRPIEPAGLSAHAADAILSDDAWRAARYGLDALITEPSGRGGSICVHDAIGDLVEDMMPVALSIGEAESLRGIERILTEGNATDRVRAFHAEHCDWRKLVEWLQEETLRGTGVQRVPA